MSNVGQFFTDLQLQQHTLHPTRRLGRALPGAGRAIPHTRSPGYYPRDLRSMYDVTNATNYGTGQTIGFTLWGAAEVQAAVTAFATTTGETASTDDTPCVATGNSPTTPSSCTTIQSRSNHLLNVLENGNTNNNYGGERRDRSRRRGLARHGAGGGGEVLPRRLLVDAVARPHERGSCNGSDVGLEDAIEDSANDPTLHSVSDSWGYGPDPEGGATDPFEVATNNSQAIAAAAGTTFWCATGDSGTYWAGYPCDSPYVVGVGGTLDLLDGALSAARRPPR